MKQKKQSVLYTVTNDKESIRSFNKIKRNEQQLVLIDLTGDYEAEVVKEFTIHGYTKLRTKSQN